jgi:protein-serine/threonine kinase
MATVSAPRDSSGLMAEKPQVSPPASQTSSAVGSPQSHASTSQNGIAVPSAENLIGNGLAAPPSEPQKGTGTLPSALAPEKPSMTKRLTRMFSTKDAMRSDSSINSQPASGTTTPKQEPKDTPAPPKPTPPIRKPSSTDKTATKQRSPSRRQQKIRRPRVLSRPCGL